MRSTQTAHQRKEVRAAARTRCTSARTQRESTLRAAGLTRTYDLLQRLDDVVREACKEV